MSGPRLPNNEPFGNAGGQYRLHTQVPVQPIHPIPQVNHKMPGGEPLGMPPSIRSILSTSSPAMHSPSPFNATPRGFQSTEPIKISDISSEHLTERDAREQLSSFVVVRLEKLVNLDDVNEFGQPRRSAWKNVRQIIETGRTKQEIARTISYLERETKPLLKKKAALSPVIQRKIERAEEMLEKNERDPRYRLYLVQFESRLEEIKPNQVIYMTKKERQRKERKSSRKGEPKPQYDRVSITAYFKRVPKSNQNAKGMLEEKNRRQQMGHQQKTFPSPSVEICGQSPAPLMSPLRPIVPPAVPPRRGVQIHQSIPIRPLSTVAPRQVVENDRAKDAPMLEKGNDTNGFSKLGIQVIEHEDGGQSDQNHDKDDRGPRDQENPKVQIMPAGRRPPQVYHSSTQSSDSTQSMESNSWPSSHDDAMTAESSVGTSSHSSKTSRGRVIERPQQRGDHQPGRLGTPREYPNERPYDERDVYPPGDLRPAVRHVPVNLGIPKARLERRDLDFERDNFQPPKPRVVEIHDGIRRVTPSEARQEILKDGVDRMGRRLEHIQLANDASSERGVRWKDDAEIEDIRQRGALRARTQGTRDDFNPVGHKTRWTERQAEEYMQSRR